MDQVRTQKNTSCVDGRMTGFSTRRSNAQKSFRAKRESNLGPRGGTQAMEMIVGGKLMN